MKKEQIIATYPLTNTGGIAIYEANDEYVIAGLNNNRPKKYKLYNNSKGFFFNWGRCRIYLHECVRI